MPIYWTPEDDAWIAYVRHGRPDKAAAIYQWLWEFWLHEEETELAADAFDYACLCETAAVAHRRDLAVRA